MFNENATIKQVIADPVFQDFGHLLFPVDLSLNQQMTLKELSSSNVYIWYSHVHVQETLSVINHLKSRAEKNEQIFYPIYSNAEMEGDNSKRNTGLFFFKGQEGAPFSIHNAGGGFMYVGAMHDSFPHALSTSKHGYNAFALIYRPSSAYEDLARAISYIYHHTDVLQVDKNNYSLWGGSAGGRMAILLSNKQMMDKYGLSDLPQAKAAIIQYTGYNRVSIYDAPTYSCVGTNDYIASYLVMENRLQKLAALGIPTSFHVYHGLSHGFGLGRGTIAEGWINEAIKFWENITK